MVVATAAATTSEPMQCPADETESVLNSAASPDFTVTFDPDTGMPVDGIFPGGAGASVMLNTVDVVIGSSGTQPFRLLAITFTVEGAEGVEIALIDVNGVAQPNGPLPVRQLFISVALVELISTIKIICRRYFSIKVMQIATAIIVVLSQPFTTCFYKHRHWRLSPHMAISDLYVIM